MSAIEPLFRLLNIDHTNFSNKEILFLEATLLRHVCTELKRNFKNQFHIYFRSIKLTSEKENFMLEINFIRLIINDILSSKEYTLEGIALYTNTHEDVLNELMIGLNNNSSSIFLQKILELHHSVRPELYNYIIAKIKSS